MNWTNKFLQKFYRLRHRYWEGNRKHNLKFKFSNQNKLRDKIVIPHQPRNKYKFKKIRINKFNKRTSRNYNKMKVKLKKIKITRIRNYKIKMINNNRSNNKMIKIIKLTKTRIIQTNKFKINRIKPLLKKKKKRRTCRHSNRPTQLFNPVFHRQQLPCQICLKCAPNCNQLRLQQLLWTLPVALSNLSNSTVCI